MKKHKYIVKFSIIIIIFWGIFYILGRIPFRDDRIIIKDLWKSKKILITLPEYDLICFTIEVKNDNQKFEFKKLELIIKKPNGQIIFSTDKYDIRGANSKTIRFQPYFFSDPDAFPPYWRQNIMTIFLKPEVPLELEINYQEKDNQNVFQGATLLMVASCKSKKCYLLKKFSMKTFKFLEKPRVLSQNRIHGEN